MMRRGRFFRWACRYLALRVFFGVTFGFVLLSSHPARAATGYLPATGSDVSFMSEIENVVTYKEAELGTALTSSQEIALPSILSEGTVALGAEEAAAGILTASGPAGWLALGVGALLLGSSVLSGFSPTTTPGLTFGCTAAASCTSNAPGVVPGNITNGQPVFYTSVSNGTTTTTVAGSSQDAAAAEAQAWQNGTQQSITFGSPKISSATSNTYTETQTNAKTGATNSPYSFSVSQSTASGYPGTSPFSVNKGAAQGGEVMPNPAPASIQTVNSQVPSSASGQRVSPQVIAAAANNIMQQAQQQSGYSGPVIPASNPITAADVQNLHNANPSLAWPTIDQAVQPSVTMPSPPTSSAPTIATAYPSATAPSNTQTTGTTGTSGSGSGGGSGTSCGTASNPCDVTTDDSGGAQQPTDPSTTTIDTILSPITALTKPLTSFTPPAHTSTCPTADFTAFGKNLSISAHCDILNANAGLIGAAIMVLYSLTALFVLFGA